MNINNYNKLSNVGRRGVWIAAALIAAALTSPDGQARRVFSPNLARRSALGQERIDDANTKALLEALGTANPNVGEIGQLIDSGVNVNAVNESGNGFLHLAVLGRHGAIVQALLNVGAYVNMGNDENQTPLHIAAWLGDMAIVRTLVDAGADLQAADREGQTALHWAARGGNVEVIRALISFGADVQAVDDEGRTALHLL